MGSKLTLGMKWKAVCQVVPSDPKEEQALLGVLHSAIDEVVEKYTDYEAAELKENFARVLERQAKRIESSERRVDP